MEIRTKQNDMVSTLTAMPQMCDNIRATELQRLSDFSELEHTAAKAELKRLTAKYGAAAPQTLSAARSVERLDIERASIRAEIARQAIPAPDTRTDSFVIYGRVLDAEGEPLRKTTITAVGANGATLAKAAAGTNAVFKLSVPIRQPGSTPKKEGSAAEEPEITTPTPLTFQLQISRSKSRLVFKYDEVFQAMSDRLTFREILVPQEVITPAPKRKTPSKARPKA